MTFGQLIRQAQNDETGAGFTLRLWLNGGHHFEMSLLDDTNGFINGSRLTQDGYEEGMITVRVEDISAMEIVW